MASDDEDVIPDAVFNNEDLELVSAVYNSLMTLTSKIVSSRMNTRR